VCLFVCEHISRTTLAIFTKLLVHVAYGRGSFLIRQGDEIPRGMGNIGVLFHIDNALYSIAFGTRTKTAEPIEMPFGMMTPVGPRYHVLDGRLDPQGKEQFWGNVAAHCKVMGHYSDQKRLTDPNAVLDEDSGGPKEPCVRWGFRPPSGKAIFRGCPDHSKALAIFAAAVAAASLRRSLQKG